MENPYKFGDVVGVRKYVDGKRTNFLVILDDIRVNENGSMDVDAIVLWHYDSRMNTNILQGHTTIKDVIEVFHIEGAAITTFKSILHYDGVRARAIERYFLKDY